MILSNSEGSIVIPKILFKELSITETFTDRRIKGYLVYDNAFEQLERYKKSDKTKHQEFFHFRMDGTDELIINLSPVLKADSAKSKKNEKLVDIKPLTLVTTIYDTEDITKGTIESKAKKLYFWDYYHYQSINNNSRVSSGEYITIYNPDIEVQIVNNMDRRVATSDLIKYICADKLGADISDKWVTSDSKTFYISSPDKTLHDDLNYLIKQCYDDVGYPIYLTFDRLTDKYKLQSLKEIFDSYPESQREIFKFTDPYKPTKGLVPTRSNTGNTYSWPTFSKILSYKYMKMASIDNTCELNSRVASMYDSKNKRFVTSAECGHIDNAKELYKNLLNSFPAGNKNPLFITNNDKTANMNAIEEYVFEPRITVQKTISSALLLNDAIYIECLGMSNRIPGTFIEITSDTDTQGVWEDRFLGTWFVVEVKHVITATGYINNIIAVKPNMSDSLTYKTDIKRTNNG
jgi:hypothetical protein